MARDLEIFRPTYPFESWWSDESLGMGLLGNLRGSGSLSGLEIQDISP